MTAKTTYDVAKTTLDGAVEQVGIAKAQLETAEADLSKTTIYSPLDGTVSKLNSQLGERVVGTATMAGTEIMTVADLNQHGGARGRWRDGRALIKVCQKAHLEVDSFKDRKFDGVVTEIANSANNNDTIRHHRRPPPAPTPPNSRSKSASPKRSNFCRECR